MRISRRQFLRTIIVGGYVAGTNFGKLTFAGTADTSKSQEGIGEDTNDIPGRVEVEDHGPNLPGNIQIKGIGKFNFEANDISAIRDDIFQPEHFSLFDILVHLDDREEIDLEYHFARQMNTHVIDSINGKNRWWHTAYYDGGWRERNLFRMDHYPYKDRTTIKLERKKSSFIEDVYRVFREEGARRDENDGKIIIPEVVIEGQKETLEFTNVLIKPHDLRKDVFKPGTVTAIDAILSLGDQGKLNYELDWKESIGSAKIVNSYWVEAINNSVAHGRCGFVYESGSENYRFFRGNHIHIPSDVRIINSPEYEKYFWICI